MLLKYFNPRTRTHIYYSPSKISDVWTYKKRGIFRKKIVHYCNQAILPLLPSNMYEGKNGVVYEKASVTIYTEHEIHPMLTLESNDVYETDEAAFNRFTHLCDQCSLL